VPGVTWLEKVRLDAAVARRSGACVTVFDKRGNTLFAFTREQRITDSGATNAVAKEIIKRLNELKS
jgi:hypothetical protein